MVTQTTADASKNEKSLANEIIDCDVHPAFRDGLRDLAPHMTKSWRARLGLLEDVTWQTGYAGSQFSIPTNHLYVNVLGVARRDSSVDGAVPCSDPKFTATQLLDRHGIGRAVLIGQNILSIGAFPDPDVSAVISSAYNDWLQEVWLQADPRYRGVVVVPPQDPAAAATEIDRVADREGVVGVLLPLHDIAMGERFYYPIYEAAERHGLPIVVHPSGTESVFARAPRMAVAPTYYLEFHALLAQVHQANLVSLICQGVFERFSALKVVIAEGGFVWAIETMLKLDRDWLGLKDEVPWLKRPPSEYVREHIRFTSQPLLETRKPEHLLQLLEMVNAEDTFLFSSDYPHWDFDDPQRALATLPADLRMRICVQNPRALFGDRL